MDQWKHEYALSWPRGPIHDMGRRTIGSVYHHVNPYRQGFAHCFYDLELRMDTLITTAPRPDEWCRNCLKNADGYRRHGLYPEDKTIATQQTGSKP